MKQSSPKETLRRLHVVHNNKYDYSNTQLNVTRKDTIAVNCTIHGEFVVSLHEHLYNRSGCPTCRVDNLTKGTKQFINDGRNGEI